MKIFQIFFLAIAFAWISTSFASDITVVTEEYPPYNFTNNDQITGCSTDIVKEMLKRTGLSFDINSYPWSRTYKIAQETPNTLIYSIGRNAQREKLFKWIDTVVPYDVYLYKLKKRTDIVVNNFDDAKKLKVGALRDDVRAQYLEKQGFSLELVPKDSLNLKKLMSGRIDLVPFDKFGIAHLMKQEGLNVDDLEAVFRLEEMSGGLYVAASLSTEDAIVEQCTTALTTMKEDGTFDKILSNYLK
jgi:polar amino acid transport system substrate-binding protein